MINLQYVTEDYATTFIDKLRPISTCVIMKDPGIIAMLKGTHLNDIPLGKNPIATLECFLQLFIEREEYEICQTLVNTYPKLLTIKLKNENTNKRKF